MFLGFVREWVNKRQAVQRALPSWQQLPSAYGGSTCESVSSDASLACPVLGTTFARPPTFRARVQIVAQIIQPVRKQLRADGRLEMLLTKYPR